MSNGIVLSGALDTFSRFDPNGFLGSIIDQESAKRAVGNVKALEEMLRAADQFGEYASKFCLLEAQMYIQIANIKDAESKLTDSKQRLVEWIRDKSESELASILDECSQGVRILRIKHREDREYQSAIKRNAANAEYKRISDEIVAQLDSKGYTQLNSSAFIEKWSSYGDPDAQTIRAFTEKTRDRILRKNGRGLGDENGTYMLVSKCDRLQVAQIIQVRLESIVNDLKTIKQICNETHFVVPPEGVRTIVDLINSLRANETTLDISV